jgi:hypothetical protein
MILLVGAQAAGAQELQSGPQAGKSLPGPFSPLNIETGRKDDIVDAFGNKPVILIFAKRVGPNFKSLVKQIDQRVGKENKKGKPVRAAAVMIAEDDVKKKLSDFRVAEGISNVVLAIDRPGGPPGYELSKDAEVTVILYERKEVRANHAFRKRELDEQAISRIINDLTKITEDMP